jgi:hypothetical protein
MTELQVVWRRRRCCGYRVDRRLVAALARPRSGPFGPHLSLGGLDMCLSKPSSADGGRPGRWRLSVARRQKLHNPACVKMVTANGGGGGSLLRGCCFIVSCSRLVLLQDNEGQTALHYVNHTMNFNTFI